MLALASLTSLYLLTFFNRFAGLRSGNGEFFTGLAFLHGQYPYRDYFTATPCLNTFKSALLLHLFGPLLIVSRLAGALERVCIGLLLYRWLRMLFPAWAAFLASLATTVIATGDRSDPMASYNHDAILFAMLSGFAAACALRMSLGVGRRGRLLAWAAASGLAAGLCLLTKQTIGLGAVVLVPSLVGLLFLRRRTPRDAATWSTGFCVGLFLPLAAFALWLRHFALSGTFLEMCFKRGPAAKAGHLTELLTREAMVARGNLLWVGLAVLALALGARAFLRSQAQTPSTTLPGISFSWMAGLSLATVLAALALAWSTLPALYDFSKTSIYFVLFGLAALLIFLALAGLRAPLTPRQEQFLIYAACSFSVALFLSLSWPAFEAMTLPGLGLLLVGVLEGTRARGRQFAVLVILSIIFIAVREKLDLPFAFGGLGDQPVRLEDQPSRLPMLAGMRLAEPTERFLEAAVATVDRRAAARDTIFTYPEMGLLYSLTGKTYPTLSGSHNVDVVNDDFARDEASRLLRARPAVLITFSLTPEEVANEDRTWRGGRPSGQHILAAAVARLAGTYRLEGVYPVGPASREVRIFVRPE